MNFELNENTRLYSTSYFDWAKKKKPWEAYERTTPLGRVAVLTGLINGLIKH